MSQRGIDFANDWVSENVNAGPYGPEDGENPVAVAAVKLFLADAASEGITREEIEEDMGDIGDLLANAFEEATDNEVDRLANRDDTA